MNTQSSKPSITTTVESLAERTESLVAELELLQKTLTPLLDNRPEVATDRLAEGQPSNISPLLGTLQTTNRNIDRSFGIIRQITEEIQI